MQIFKFGGASIRNAEAIRNMTDIVDKYGEKPLLVVVSAMDKTTRHLEAYINGVVEKNLVKNSLEEISEFHFSIMQELFEVNDPVFEEVGDLFSKVKQIEWQGDNYSKFYDSVVSVGEMVSSSIIAAYLNKKTF
jgi:aspartate kinase